MVSSRPDPRAGKAPDVLLTALIFAACLVLTIGIPLGWLWVVAAVSDRYATAYVLALLGFPMLMALWWMFVVLPLNDAYLRGTSRPLPVLEGSVTISVLLAVIALVIWAIFIGGGPSDHWGPWPG